MTSLSEMKRKNKARDGHFFDRGNAPIISKQGNYLVTTGFGGGYIVYKFEEDGQINLVDNPYGEYSWQPHKSKADAVNYAKKLNEGK